MRTDIHSTSSGRSIFPLSGGNTRTHGFRLATNAAAWAWGLIVFHHDPALFGVALLAYGLGQHHAAEADRNLAIDTVAPS
jgi:high-affinity nickel permease